MLNYKLIIYFLYQLNLLAELVVHINLTYAIRVRDLKKIIAYSYLTFTPKRTTHEREC
jgi:hypothetical protein